MDSTAEMKRKPRPATKNGRRPDIGSDLKSSGLDLRAVPIGGVSG